MMHHKPRRPKHQRALLVVQPAQDERAAKMHRLKGEGAEVSSSRRRRRGRRGVSLPRATRTPKSARRRMYEWVPKSVPDKLRQQIDHWAARWLNQKFARGLELRAADPGSFDYPVEVFSEWRGKAFYICAHYRTIHRT